MAPCDSVSTSGTLTKLLRRIGTQFHSSLTSLTNWAVQRSTPSLTSVLATTMFVLQQATSGRQPFKCVTAPSSSWSCPWDLPMLPLSHINLVWNNVQLPTPHLSPYLNTDSLFVHIFPSFIEQSSSKQPSTHSLRSSCPTQMPLDLYSRIPRT